MEPGTQLGHYTISSLIGKGGMGEVYQAKDETLGRQVAIKVLPEAFAQDSQRVARFRREAQLLASLNHPNIAAIHGLEEDDGKHFLVLELVEGDTLADRLKSGAIPVGESLKLALQIAEALEAAHEKGVIHRDLKPANIKVTDDGKVKVLDFGLAKAFAGDQGDVSVSNSPTISMAATQQGIILGTAAYMSPEQAKGRETDKRTDIFAFGAVLYEMLTAKPAFPGDDVSDILASVLKTDPDWNDLPVNLHHRLKELLERSLEKDLSTRYHDVADTRVDIQKVLADPSGVIVQPVVEGVQAKSQSKLPWVAAIVIATLLTGASVWTLRPASGELQSVIRFPFVLPADQQFTRTNPQMVDVSRDGSQFVYAANNNIYLRNLDEMESRVVQGTEDEDPNQPIFSPDGLWLAYHTGANGAFSMKRIPVGGGTPVTVWEGSSRPNDKQWEGDDTILFVQPEGILRIPANGGEAEVIVEAGEAELLGTPRLLPGGEGVLFSGGLPSEAPPPREWDAAEIFVQPMGSNERTLIWEGGSDARYVPTGHVVYAQGNTLFALPFDLDNLAVTGGATPILEGIRRSGNGGRATGQYAFSDNGTLVSVPGSGPTPVPNAILAWVDRNGEREPLPVPPRPYRHPQLSPDGTRLAVQTTDANGESDIWIYNLDDNTQMRQMTGAGNNMRPIWTPDSERLTFTSDRDGQERIYSQSADLSSVAEPLTGPEVDGPLWPQSWTPDGRTLSFQTFPGGDGVLTLSLDDGAVPEVFAPGGNSAFSPDGKWLVYRHNRDGEQLYMQPFPTTGTEYRLTQEGGSAPIWSRDGRELFYRRGTGALGLGPTGGGQAREFMAVDINLDGTPEWTNERALPIEGFLVFVGSRDYDITPDGERFLMIFPADQADSSEPSSPQINIVLNWFQELRERVPVD